MKRKKSKRPGRLTTARSGTKESQAAEAVTVAWMLGLFSTFSAECVGVFVRLMMMARGDSDRLPVLSVTLLLVALLSGLITLLLTPLVLKLRTVPPPRAIVVAACFIGTMPIATLILIGLMSSA